jgi:glycine/D-amino acid oxidase-like deaminating enzyme
MIRQRYPAWNTEIWSEGYFNKRGGWAESGRVVAKLAQKAIQNGVRLLIGTVQQLIIEIVDIKNTQRVKGVLLESGESIYGDFVIVAAGAWTPILLPHLRTVMTPKAQPIFHFGLVDSLLQSGVISKKTFPPFLADISETGFYGFCPHPTDGRIKLGHHGRGYPMEILTKEAVAKKWEEVKEFETRKFRDFLEDAFPQTLAKAPVVYTRLCFYCDTLDGDFWIDHDPKVAGLVVAAGGSGHGFKFAPMLGSIIADVLEKKPNKFAYRFRWRVPDPSRGEESRYRFAESYKNQLSHITPNQKTLSSSTIVSSRHSSLQFVQPKL